MRVSMLNSFVQVFLGGSRVALSFNSRIKVLKNPEAPRCQLSLVIDGSISFLVSPCKNGIGLHEGLKIFLPSPEAALLG